MENLGSSIGQKIYFRGKSYIEENVTQDDLVFQPIYQYFQRVIGVGIGNYTYFWKSKGLFGENITVPTTRDYSLNLQLSYFSTKTRVEFKGSCLKQDKIS